MSFNITDEVLQKIGMSDKQLKQEIAILLFEQEQLNLEEATNFAKEVIIHPNQPEIFSHNYKHPANQVLTNDQLKSNWLKVEG